MMAIRTITIATDNGPKPADAEVLKGGLFAVVIMDGGRYTVTHVPSGGRMPGTFRTKTAARQSARFLAVLLKDDPFYKQTDFKAMNDSLKQWQRENPDTNAALMAHWKDIKAIRAD